jgi:hypothetical protein
LEWEEILWGNNSILIQGEKRMQVWRSFKYYKRRRRPNDWEQSNIYFLEVRRREG